MHLVCMLMLTLQPPCTWLGFLTWYSARHWRQADAVQANQGKHPGCVLLSSGVRVPCSSQGSQRVILPAASTTEECAVYPRRWGSQVCSQGALQQATAGQQIQASPCMGA